MLSVNYAECRKKANYAEYLYAERHYAECRGASRTTVLATASTMTDFSHSL